MMGKNVTKALDDFCPEFISCMNPDQFDLGFSSLENKPAKFQFKSRFTDFGIVYGNIWLDNGLNVDL